MKQRLIAYLIFLPLVLLAAFTDIDSYLTYLAWASIPASIALIIYAFIKTKSYYKMKKCLLFAILGGACCFFTIPAQAQIGDAILRTTSPAYATVMLINDVYNANLAAESAAAFEVMARIGRIPVNERTPAQQREYEQAKAKYEDLQRRLNRIPCPTAQDLYAEATNDCWSCDVAALFIEAADKVTTSFYKVDKEYGLSFSLLALGLMFWILTHVMTLLMSFGKGDIGAFFTALFNKLLLAGGVFILLSFPLRNTVDFFISPFFIFSAAMTEEIGNITNEINESSGKQRVDKTMADTFGQRVQCKACDDLKNGTQSLPDTRVSSAVQYSASLDERIVTPLMRNSILCSVCNIYGATIAPTVTGQFMYCASKNITADGRDYGLNNLYGDWGTIITSLSLIFSFFLVSTFFAFYLIDSFFRICVVMILFPFLIVAFVFKSTRHYTKRGLDVIIHAMATYIIIALFLAITIQIFYVMIGPDAAQMAALTDANNFNALKEMFAFGENGGRITLCCIGILVIVYLILKQLDSYISALTGISLQNSGGGAAAMAVVATVKKIGGAVASVYSEQWKKPGNDSGNSAEDKAAKIRAYGEDTKDGASEKAVDGAADGAEKGINKGGDALANGIDKAGTAASKGMMKSGLKLCTAGYGLGAIIGIPLIIAGAALYAATKTAKYAIKISSRVAAKASKAAIKYGGRAVIKTAKRLNPVKMIARNKYFNKTVGLFWQIGSDSKDKYRNYKASREKKKRKKRKNKP